MNTTLDRNTPRRSGLPSSPTRPEDSQQSERIKPASPAVSLHFDHQSTIGLILNHHDNTGTNEQKENAPGGEIFITASKMIRKSLVTSLSQTKKVLALMLAQERSSKPIGSSARPRKSSAVTTIP